LEISANHSARDDPYHDVDAIPLLWNVAIGRHGTWRRAMGAPVKALSRVVWSEGMHLSQHHFQAQARYFEDLIAFAIDNLHFRAFGVAGLTLDAEALLNGTVLLTHARGVMPDGLTFHFPADAAPEPLEIRDLFSPTQDSHLVLLTIPPFVPGRPNCADDSSRNGTGPRFRIDRQGIVDEATGGDEKQVGLARKNFRLVLDHQLEDDLVALPLARIRRDGSGHFVYDFDYIPPSLQIAASPRLMKSVSELVEMLEAKAAGLAAERSGSEVGASLYGASDLTSLWLAHAVHAALGPLRHFLQSGRAHPEKLFLEMSRLAGALCTFSLSSNPRDLPLYDHDSLDRCFGALERHIRQHLQVVMPTNCVTIPLRTGEDTLMMGTVTDSRCLHGARWYLGIRTSMGAADSIGRIPRLLKICSAKHIARLVREAFPGMTIVHDPAPPRELPVRPGTLYFAVQLAGPCWSSIVETGEVGLYVPDAIQDAHLELLVVLDA
jgi:type VI secretion system protein ImpJ